MQYIIFQLKYVQIKLILLLIFISVLGFSQQGSVIQISGFLYNSEDGLPLANHQINILVSDSVNRNNNDIYTDSSGHYKDTVHTKLHDGIVMVYVYDCENKISTNVYSFSGNTNVSANFTICTNSPKSCNAYFYSALDTAYPTINLLHFYDSSYASTNIVSWEWDFGDGQTSTVQDTHHIYYFPGKYNVCLRIETVDSCSSTYCDTVNASNQGPNTCTADFTTQVDTSNPLGYLFLDNSITTGGIIQQMLWIFGDGDSSTLTAPYHVYAQKGIYEVKFGIYTSDACVDIHIDTIYVDTIISNTCQANFQFSHDTTSSHPYDFNFSDNSITPNSSVISWFWYFDDGIASYLQNPNHQFICAGNYNIRLTILTADSCSSTYIKQITVGNPQKYIIGGHVFSGSYPPIDTGVAYLYQSFGNFIKPIDTMAFGNLGYYYFIDIYEGFYKVKVAPHQNSNFYNSNAPTYYIDELFWESANEIFLNSYNIALNVHLMDISPSSGSGSISGYVVQGGKSKTTGVEINNVEILLLDMSDNPIKYTYSDNNGYFNFNNLAFGTYKVYAEATGLYTSPVSVALSQNNPNVSGVMLQILDSNITGVVIYDYNPLSSIGNIYPNPLEKNLNIEFNIVSTTSFTISIIDIVGRQIMEKEVTLNVGFQCVNIPVDYLKSGMYILNIKSKDGRLTKTKKILK